MQVECCSKILNGATTALLNLQCETCSAIGPIPERKTLMSWVFFSESKTYSATRKPGSLEKLPGTTFLQNWYCIASCALCDTFKVKCSISGAKSAFGFSRKRWTWIWQCSLHWFLYSMYRCSLEVKCPVSGAKR